MKKDIDDILLPITQEEFVNITNLLFSEDSECRILAKEFLKTHNIETGDWIRLTDDFWITPWFRGWFKWSTGEMSGPKAIYKRWKELVSKNSQQE